MERIAHELIQGTDAWNQFRLEHNGASEAAAALGISTKTSRTELLTIKHTGIAKVFGDWVQEHILDYGHEVEALARPIAEEIIGDDLFPVTYSYGRMSASCDGLTMDDSTAFEHKQWSEKLSAAVSREELPDEYQPQCQQVMYVTGAERLLFMVSNGTKEQCVWMWVYPDPEWIKRIIAGWKQFDTDLFNFVPAEVIPASVAAPTLDLPAVSIQTTGQIAIRSNLRVFGEALQGFIERLPTNPSTDQEFADCKAALAKLKTAEECLESEEVRALSQMSEIDEMRREKKFLQDLARTTRLALGTMVAQREAAIKQEIIQEGKDKLADHIAQLNKRLGRVQMPAVAADFAGAIKSKRTVESLRNAVDTCLANAKIAANDIADKISINLAALDEHKEHAFLFNDVASLAMKANDDLINVMKLRISEHQSEQQKKLDDEREKIRKEEHERADREAADKLAASQREAADKSEAERKEQERIAAAAAPVPVVAETLNTPQPAASSPASENAPAPVRSIGAWPFPKPENHPARVEQQDTAWKIAEHLASMNDEERLLVLHYCERVIEERAKAAA